MAEKIDLKQSFIDTLTILATKLNKREYDKVTSVMYSLHCGVSMGFGVADPMLLPTFEEIWNLNKDNILVSKINILEKSICYCFNHSIFIRYCICNSSFYNTC